MSSYLHDTLLNRYIRSVSCGYPRTITAGEIESDMRRQKKAVRELVGSDYISPAEPGNPHEITSKVWDELTSEPVNLTELWDGSRKDWNKEGKHALVRFNSLTEGQQKFILENPDLYKWYVYETSVFQWGGENRVIVGPKNITDITSVGAVVNKMIEDLTTEYRKRDNRYTFINFEICISSESLENHARDSLERENFDALYGQNLLWYLQKVGILTSTERVVQSDEPNWINGSRANLGKDPNNWSTRLQEGIRDTKERLAALTRQLATLEALEQGVSEQGGWDTVKANYEKALREHIAEKATKVPTQNSGNP